MDEILEILERRAKDSQTLYSLFMNAPYTTKLHEIWTAYLELIDIVDPIVPNQALWIQKLKECEPDPIVKILEKVGTQAYLAEEMLEGTGNYLLCNRHVQYHLARIPHRWFTGIPHTFTDYVGLAR